MKISSRRFQRVLPVVHDVDKKRKMDTSGWYFKIKYLSLKKSLVCVSFKLSGLFVCLSVFCDLDY